MATITDRDFDEMAKLANSAHASLAQWTAEGNEENRDSIDDVLDAEDALASLCGAFRAYQAKSNAMQANELKVNDSIRTPGGDEGVVLAIHDGDAWCELIGAHGEQYHSTLAVDELTPIAPQTEVVRVDLLYDGFALRAQFHDSDGPRFGFDTQVVIDPTGEVVAPSAWVATLEFQLRATHNNIENMTNDQIRQALEVAIGTIPAAPSSEEATASDDAEAKIERYERMLRDVCETLQHRAEHKTVIDKPEDDLLLGKIVELLAAAQRKDTP